MEPATPRECACPRPHPPGEDEFRHVVSIVAPGLAVSGQPMKRDTVPPASWEARGVHLVIDLTDDGSPITTPMSAVSRVWLPAPDDGSPRDPRWFESTTAAAERADSVLVHCHMGVARGPSVAFAILLTRGWHEIDALEAVMFGRPIASVGYAADALRWWLGPSADEVRIERMEIRRHELLAVLRDRIVAG